MGGISFSKEYFITIATFIWIIFRVFLFLFKFIKKEPTSKIRELIILFTGLWIIFVVGITIFPISIIWVTDPVVNDLKVSINLIPLIDIFISLKSLGVIQWGIHYIGNLILLAPLAIFVPILASEKSKWKTLKWNIILGFSISLSIELIQYIICVITPLPSAKFSRSTDINDLILNTLGIFIGFFIYKLLFYKVKANRIDL